jgi:uncharacterized oxidoreductase
MDITKDTVLVTGGGSGIGKAMAEALHARGAKVIIAGRRADVLAQVAAANPGMAYDVVDVADARAVEAFVARVIAAHPDLNTVISNAGIMVPEDLSTGRFDWSLAEQMIDINWWGTVRLAGAVLPHLLTKPRATFVTVSSGLAFVPLAATPTYSATKAAIHSWSQSLRHQLKDTSVKVIEWAPPAVATDLMPGHAQNPSSMPLADFTAQSLSQFESGDREEILVDRVRFLRDAEARGDYDKVFSMLNDQAH